MTVLPLPFHPDAPPPGNPARARDGADPVAPAAGELPRVLSPGEAVTVDGLRGKYKVRRLLPECVQVVGDYGHYDVAAGDVRRVL